MLELRNLIATGKNVYATINNNRATIYCVMEGFVWVRIHGRSVWDLQHKTTLDQLTDISFDILPT